MNREIDKFIEELQRDAARRTSANKKADEPKPEPEKAQHKSDPANAARILRERLRRKPPVPGGTDRGIRGGETETK